mgnify:FL=1
MKKLIAITGGIGSGKSLLTDYFASLGYAVLSADEIYSDLLKDEYFVKGICNAVGVRAVLVNGRYTLDRKAVAEKVFGNPAERKKLDDFTHEAIMREMFSRANDCSGVVFCEVPLLFESGYDKYFDCVIVVFRNENERINSVVSRDNKSEELVKEIIKNQYDYSKLAENGHTIFVENNGTPRFLYEKANEIIEKINN